MVSYLARTNCRSWVKRRFAAPTIRGILGVELPSPDMTVPVTERTFPWCDPTGRNGRSHVFSFGAPTVRLRETGASKFRLLLRLSVRLSLSHYR